MKLSRLTDFFCFGWAKFRALKRSHQVLSLVAIFALLWLFVGLLFMPSDRMEDLTVNQAKVIYVNSIAENKIKFLNFHSTAEAEKKVKLVASGRGIVFEIKVNKGDQVKKHQELAAISPMDYHLILSTAENKVRELEEIIAEEEVAMPKLAADLTKAKVELDKAKHYAKNMVIRSPIDGRVEGSEVSLGDAVNQGQELFLVVNSEQIKCKAYLSSDEYNQLKNDSEAVIIDSSGSKHQAKVRFISKSANQKNLSYEVEVIFDNKGEKVREGASVDILLVSPEAKSHKLPLAALVINDNGDLGVMLYNPDDSRAYFKKVEVIDQDKEFIWIVGIGEAASVIIMGQSSIENGAAVIAKSQQ